MKRKAAAQVPPGRMLIRLSLMMLLEFVVFGSWYGTLGLVLVTNKLPMIIGAAYSLSAVAAILTPLFLGALGDRYFESQKVLGVSHFLGALLLLCVPFAIKSASGQLSLALIFVYSLLFVPTLGLINSIAFYHLGKDQHLFPYVRIFAPTGWVVAGLGVGWLGLSASTGVFVVAGAVSLVFAAYSFTLPSTPPPAKGARFSMGDIVGAEALVLFRNRNFTVLMICATLTAIAFGVYNSYTSPYLGALGVSNVAGVLALGQITEIPLIASIPFVLRRIGMKWALLMGMGMWGIRFALFALAARWGASAAIVGIALHGICNDFFLVLSAMYIDRVAPAELRAQAQSWLIIVISGFGIGLGSFAAGQIYAVTVARHAALDLAAWEPLWFLPIASAAITAILWVSCFKYSRKQETAIPAAAVP